jgi:hypothetical protein
VYQVYHDQLAESVEEYHVVAYLTATTDIGSSSRSSKGGVASTPELAIQFAAMEAITDLRYHEVQMQIHPGFFHYPTLSPSTGRVVFPPIEPEADRAAGVLSQYICASYRMIISLAEEMNRIQEALAAVSPAPPLSPDPPGYPSPVPPPHTVSIPSGSSGLSGISSGSRRETPAEWASLLDTPAPPMLRRRASSPAEGETSRQRRRVSFDPATHIISSDSDSGSGDDDSSEEQCLCHRRH